MKKFNGIKDARLSLPIRIFHKSKKRKQARILPILHRS
jgi:hypothetical protein